MTIALVACGTAQSSPDSEAVETVKEVVESADTENSEAVSETEQATEAPVDEAVPKTESAEIASEPENSETASTPETSTEENSEAVSEPDSEAVVEPEFTVTEVTATKYATQSVNVRSGPSTDYDKIGSLSTNQEITVNGVCDQTGWFRFDLNGTVAFVSNRYVSDEKVEKPATSEGAASNTGSTSTECPYPMYQVIDDGGDSVYYYCTENDINWTIYDQCAEIIANRHGHSLYQNGGDCGKGGGLGPVKTNYTYNGQIVYRQRPCAFISQPGAGPAGATEVFQCP